MENKQTPDPEFENLLREQLQNIDQDPAADTWDNIAKAQRGRNLWLRARRHAPLAAAAAFLLGLALVGWQQWAGQALPQASSGLPNAAQPQATPPEAAPAALADRATIGAGASNTPKGRYTPPSFGARPNTVPVTTRRFAAETGLDYQDPETGTRLHIPANSLVDRLGRKVQGDVELVFREYRSIPEFLASGLPMHYADARGEFAFNSGGMFEVRVVQGAEPLRMAPGKHYDLDFSPTHALDDASLFHLDDATGNWRYQPDAVMGQANLPPVVTEARAGRNNQGNLCVPFFEEIPATTEASMANFIQTGIQTGLELAEQKREIPAWFVRNPTLSDEQLLNGMERGLVRISPHRDQSALFFPEDLENFFTELAAFKDCYFTQDVTNPGTTLLERNSYWQRITIRQEIGPYCWISLYDGKEKKMRQFYAKLTATVLNKAFDPDKIMAEYRSLRDKRQTEFEAKNRALRCFAYLAPSLQTEQEWCMNHSEWMAHFSANLPQMQRRYAALIAQGLLEQDSAALRHWQNWRTRYRQLLRQAYSNLKTSRNAEQTIRYAMKLNNFGTYNCDQIFRLGIQEMTLAHFKKTDGSSIKTTSITVMDRSTRLFFTLPRAKIGDNRVPRAPGRTLDLVVTDIDGRQYHLPGKKYAAHPMPKSETLTLTLDDVTDRTGSPYEWGALLEM
jgi:hypothetical protein